MLSVSSILKSVLPNSLLLVSLLLPLIATSATKEVRKSKKNKSVTAAAAVVVETPAVIKATLYEKGSQLTKPLFRYEKSTFSKGDDRRVEVQFKEMDGRLALKERVEYSLTQGFHKMERDHMQIGEITTVERKQNEVVFFRSEKGKEYNDREKFNESVICNDQINSVIQKSWAEVMQGKTLEFRLLVPSRLETVGFRVSKKSEEGELKGQLTITFQLEPTSMFIRSFVDPIVFHYSKTEPHRLLLIRGRMPVKTMLPGEKYRDAEGDLLFEY